MTKLQYISGMYCKPVPQIANGFAVSATNVTYGGAAKYECYKGFHFMSGKSEEEIYCTDEGRWTPTPMCKGEFLSEIEKFKIQNVQLKPAPPSVHLATVRKHFPTEMAQVTVPSTRTNVPLDSIAKARPPYCATIMESGAASSQLVNVSTVLGIRYPLIIKASHASPRHRSRTAWCRTWTTCTSLRRAPR